MSAIMPYIWIGIIVFAALAEIYTFALVTVWFIPAAAAAFILSLTEFHVWVQTSVFFIIFFVLFFLSRTIFRKSVKSGRNFANTHISSDKDLSLFIGKSAIVTQEINNYKNAGKIKISSFEFAAKSDDDDIIYESGLIVSVVRTDGGYAICSR